MTSKPSIKALIGMIALFLPVFTGLTTDADAAEHKPILHPSVEAATELIETYQGNLQLPVDEINGRSNLPNSLPNLSRLEAEAWKQALWNAWILIRERSAEMDPIAPDEGRGAVDSGAFKMVYTWKRSGSRPENGWPLFINLHGGGDSKEMNDKAWQMAKRWYAIANGYLVCPRAPVDEIESWIMAPVYPLLEEMLKDFYALMDIDVNRVYIIGFSMGGWATMHLGPVLADHWAAVAASAGGGFVARSPPQNLRNTPLMINVGADDSSYGRNSLSEVFAESIVKLREIERGGYVLSYRRWPGRGHMIPEGDTPEWCSQFERNPIPAKIIWFQPWSLLTEDAAYAGMLRKNFYWLRNESPQAGQRLIVARKGNLLEIDAHEVPRITILLDDRMVDLDKPIIVRSEGAKILEGSVPRRIETMIATLLERGDPQMIFSGKCEVTIPSTPNP